MKKIFAIILVFFSVLLLPSFSKIIFADNLEFDSSNYTNFVILSENDFYCVNKTTNKITHFINDSVVSFGRYGENDQEGEFGIVQILRILKNGEIVIYDDLNKVHFFDSSFNHIVTIKTIKITENNKTTFKALGKITDIATDVFSNIYLTDYENGYILKTNSSFTNFELQKQISFSQNCKLTILNTTSQIVLLDNSMLITDDNQIMLNNNPIAIFSDAKNFVYVVYDNFIEKYKDLVLIDTKSDITKGDFYSINLVNGTIYYFNGEIVSLKGFATNIQDLPLPTDYTQKTALNEICKIYYLTKPAPLLKNPYSATQVSQLNKDDQVIFLSNVDEFENSFYFVMTLTNQGYQTGFIENRFLAQQTIPQKEVKVKPIRKDIPYYKYPNLSSDFCLSVLNNENISQIAEISLNGQNFSVIKLDNSYVYVNSNDIIDADNEYISTFLTTNAVISPYKNDVINFYKDEEKTSVYFPITTKTNVRLIKSYQNNLSEIEILWNNKILHGFVETKYFVPQNDFTIPLTIILSFICIITLVIIVIKFKKDNTKK